MGRTKKQTSDARPDVLRIRLSLAERKALDAGAKAAKLSTSTWARSALLKLAEREN